MFESPHAEIDSAIAACSETGKGYWQKFLATGNETLLAHIGYDLIRSGCTPEQLRIYLTRSGINAVGAKNIRGYIQNYDPKKLSEFHTGETITALTEEQKESLIRVCAEFSAPSLNA